MVSLRFYQTNYFFPRTAAGSLFARRKFPPLTGALCDRQFAAPAFRNRPFQKAPFLVATSLTKDTLSFGGFPPTPNRLCVDQLSPLPPIGRKGQISSPGQGSLFSPRGAFPGAQLPLPDLARDSMAVRLQNSGFPMGCFADHFRWHCCNLLLPPLHAARDLRPPDFAANSYRAITCLFFWRTHLGYPPPTMRPPCPVYKMRHFTPWPADYPPCFQYWTSNQLFLDFSLFLPLRRPFLFPTNELLLALLFCFWKNLSPKSFYGPSQKGT